MKNIIIFDKNHVKHSLLQYDLKMLDCNVIFSKSEEETHGILNDGNIHVLVVNYDYHEIDCSNFCEIIRKSNRDVYIIALSSKDDVLSKLEAFRSGVDDYIITPYAIREVIARINVFFRRNINTDENMVIDYKHLKIFPGKREIHCQEELVQLTFKEFELVKYLIENRNIVVSREMILLKVWKYEYSGETRVIDMYISKIREKLLLDTYLKTIRSVGYMLID